MEPQDNLLIIIIVLGFCIPILFILIRETINNLLFNHANQNQSRNLTSVVIIPSVHNSRRNSSFQNSWRSSLMAANHNNPMLSVSRLSLHHNHPVCLDYDYRSDFEFPWTKKREIKIKIRQEIKFWHLFKNKRKFMKIFRVIL